jgi:hypothetical protein
MKNHFTKSLLVLAIGGLMYAGPAVAQSGAGPGVDDPNHPRVNEVNQRQENQQKRIASGVEDGQLKPGQAANLEKGQARIDRTEKRDMRQDNGHLTKADQKQLNRMQNKQSAKIYKDKH